MENELFHVDIRTDMKKPIINLGPICRAAPDKDWTDDTQLEFPPTIFQYCSSRNTLLIISAPLTENRKDLYSLHTNQSATRSSKNLHEQLSTVQHMDSFFCPLWAAVFNVVVHTGCPTRYLTRHFFYNCNTNEDIATQFGQEYVRCVGNGKECFPARYMKNPFIQRRLVFGVGRPGAAYLVPSSVMQPSRQLYIWNSSTPL